MNGTQHRGNSRPYRDTLFAALRESGCGISKRVNQLTDRRLAGVELTLPDKRGTSADVNGFGRRPGAFRHCCNGPSSETIHRSGRCHVGPSICREHNRPTLRLQGAAAGGSSEGVTNLIDGQHWILQMGEVPYARKKSQFRAHSFGELYSHLFVDVEVFLAPNDLHGRLEPGKLRFEVILRE